MLSASPSFSALPPGQGGLRATSPLGFLIPGLEAELLAVNQSLGVAQKVEVWEGAPRGWFPHLKRR